MDSANGTYVNGLATHTSLLAPGDIFRIGPYKLVYRHGTIEHHDDSRAVRLDVHAVTKTVGGRMLLSGISMNARPGEVLAIAGTSGAGKSTLIDALNGSRPPTSGHILVNGADLYQAYDALRPLIGYVPQETILPLLLTVRRALHYVARLRLPADVGQDEADARIDDVMRRLDLYERRDVQISRLSGGQQKRASIAAELISSPGLFFLDEPTSGLDPGLTRRVTAILHELAASGRTVVVISHDVEGLASADRIVFLAAGGHVAFIGTPNEALSFFKVDSLAEIYTRVDADGAQAWAARQRPVADGSAPSENGLNSATTSNPAAGTGLVPSWDPVATISASVRSGTSSWRQFRILTARYAETVFRDRRNMALLLLQAPIIGILLTLVAKTGDLRPPPAAVAAQAAQFGIPAAKLASSLPLMLAASAVWFGAINAAREIVKELPILRRERLAGLRPAPYLASKLAVLMLLCVLQTTALLAIVALKARVSGPGVFTATFLELWITLNLASFAALGLGLLISASFSNADRAQSLVPIILIPQLIFVGGAGTGAAASWVSYLMITHWAVEAMKISAGIPFTTTGGSFDASALALRWSIMGAMGIVFSALATWQVSRSRQG
jgi:ABC-type multidrug transport system ATPase subunit